MMKKINVLIDNGHGVNTPGKRSPKWPNGKQLFEWQFNRQVAKKLYDLCKQHDFLNPVLLVTEDNDVSLGERCRRANKYDAKSSLFISIHGNAGPETARGFEVYTTPGQNNSDKFAECIYRQVSQHAKWLKLRHDVTDGDDDYEAHFYVIKNANMPAVLTENGFFTNEEECMNMLDSNHQDDIAAYHLAGIIDYCKAYMQCTI